MAAAAAPAAVNTLYITKVMFLYVECLWVHNIDCCHACEQPTCLMLLRTGKLPATGVTCFLLSDFELTVSSCASCCCIMGLLILTMLCCPVLCPNILSHMPCHAMLCYAMLCYAMLCHAMLCYAMLCHAMPCYAMPEQTSNYRQSELLPVY